MNPKLSHFFLFLTSVLLCSCIEGEEEIWIQPDASGRLRIHYELPQIALLQLPKPEEVVQSLHKIDQSENSLQITALSFEKKKGKIVFHLEAAFKDARKLTELPERYKDIFITDTSVNPQKIEHISGKIDFKLEGLTPTFFRSIDLSELFPAILKKFPKRLGASNFKYTIHLPAKVKESNAHSISEDGKTLQWTFFLQEQLTDPIEMAFTTELPLPWWLWPLLGLLSFTLIRLIWRKSIPAKTP